MVFDAEMNNCCAGVQLAIMACLGGRVNNFSREVENELWLGEHPLGCIYIYPYCVIQPTHFGESDFMRAAFPRNALSHGNTRIPKSSSAIKCAANHGRSPMLETAAVATE